MTKRLDAAIARPAAERLGLATRAQFRDAGFSDEAVDVRLEAGLLIPDHRGVLRHALIPISDLTRLHGAVLACGSNAVVSHRSAAALHGIDGIKRHRPEVTVVGTRLPRRHDITLHRTNWLPDADRSQVHGLPVTTVARTLLGLGAVLPFEVVERSVQTAVVQGLVDLPALVAVLDRSGRRGRNGTAPLRAIAREAMPDVRIESMLENDLLSLVRRAGLPPPTLQHEIVAGGRAVRLDIAWPEVRVAIEGDGHRWHATRAQVERDRARRRAIVAAGWELYVYGWSDVHDRGAAVLQELSALLPRFVSR